MKIKIWARIGTTIVIDVEKPTRNQIGDALREAINKNNTGSETFYPIGETYIPEDNCIEDEQGHKIEIEGGDISINL